MKYKLLRHSPLIYLDMEDGRTVTLQKSVNYTFTDTDILVSRNFVSDLASIPRPLQGIFPRFGPWNPAALLHDWLYVQQRIGTTAITRAQADRRFLAALRASPSVSPIASYSFFIAVRLGGRARWTSHHRT